MYSNRDWRTALLTPPTYRIGNRTLRFNYHIVLIILLICLLFIIIYILRWEFPTNATTRLQSTITDTNWPSMSIANVYSHQYQRIGGDGDQILYDNSNNLLILNLSSYNSIYPLTAPIKGRSDIIYRIAVVADLDAKSKVEINGQKFWRSYMKIGYLTYGRNVEKISIKWNSEPPLALESSFSLKDRGMELSELVTFNGRLLSFDDRTGLVYELLDNKAIPWLILMDGDGKNSKGFKAEWATVKDRMLYVGSMGKEWTNGGGEFLNNNPMFVKRITTAGTIEHLDWSANFKSIRQQSAQITWPGYMIHESCVWSSIHKKWFFLPRRCSKDRYNETLDELMGCNLLITADENFNQISSVPLDVTNWQTPLTHGVSSFKFLPNTNDQIIIALFSEELNGKTATHIMAFDIKGKILLPAQYVDTEHKYEGFEFV